MFRGKLFLKLKDLTRAAEEFNRAVKHDNHNVHMLTCLMDTQVKLARQARNKDNSEAAISAASHAKELADKILRSDPSHEGAQYTQEDMYREFKVE